jgi:TPR repeat protein
MVSRYAQRSIRGAKKGDPNAQLWLGKLYLTGGEGLAQNLHAALRWLTGAAKAGIREAQILIAENVPADIGAESAEYAQICEIASARGSWAAYERLGDLWEKADPHRSAEAYLVAAQHGRTKAAMHLGVLLAQNGALAKSIQQDATTWLELAAEAGETAAIRPLAERLWESNPGRSIRWLEVLANQGDAEAMYRVGSLLIETLNGADDVRRGTYWLEKAARKGHPKSLLLYGRLHSRALSPVPTEIPNSLIQASRLLERAAALGVAEANLYLAKIHKMEGFSQRDPSMARQYVHRAAEAGLMEAELEHGKHLAKYGNDKAAWLEAGIWLSRAAEKGSQQAVKLLARISEFPPTVPDSVFEEQERMLGSIKSDHPLVAARLMLAGTFGLRSREALFIDPVDAYKGWCLKVDLTKHFKYRPWRLIAIRSDRQLGVIEHACQTFVKYKLLAPDIKGSTTRGRARQLSSLLARFAIRPELYIADWSPPS